MTSAKQPVDQTTRVEEPTTSKDAGNVANIGVPEQVPEQVAPMQGLSDPLTDRQIPETNQGVPEQTIATTNSTLSGLSDVAA
jgi:hypothetical protein